jgi:hypothetical protein
LLKYIKRSERFIVVCEYHIGGVIVPATSVWASVVSNQRL